METVRELVGTYSLGDCFTPEELTEKVEYLRERHKTQLGKYDTVEEEVHAESYDEYYCTVELRLYGTRQKTQEEIDRSKGLKLESETIWAIAKELDISYHEASLVNRLKDKERSNKSLTNNP